jgi:hypothetical protein
MYFLRREYFLTLYTLLACFHEESRNEYERHLSVIIPNYISLTPIGCTCKQAPPSDYKSGQLESRFSRLDNLIWMSRKPGLKCRLWQSPGSMILDFLSVNTSSDFPCDFGIRGTTYSHKVGNLLSVTS